MARTTKQLTDKEIATAKPKDKTYMLVDGGGLLLRINPNGSKLWRFNYYKPFTKKRTEISLGDYPTIRLLEARAIREEYRALLAQDIDPLTHREKQQRTQAEEVTRTFKALAAAWFEDRKLKANFAERTAKDTWTMLERHALPQIGDYPITQLTPLLVINTLKPLATAGKLTTLHKTITKINEIMRYALHRELIPYNPLSEIYKEFDRPPESKGMPTIKPEELGDFLKLLFVARDVGRFSLSSFYAVMLVLLTGSRPSEIAAAKWADIDFNSRIWAYRVQKGNKNLPEGRLHKVTLSTQALGILAKMQEMNALLYPIGSPFVFPSTYAKSRHITIEAIRQAIIKAVGGVGTLTTHGLRHLLSTTLNEKNYHEDWIEKSLSHKIKGTIRRTYNKAEYLEQRFTMFQAWADYVESLTPNKIV